MKKILSILISAIFFLVISNDNVNAQGCVAIKGSGASCMLSHSNNDNKGGWQFTTGLRYFKSFRHFSGRTENKERLVQGSEVINHSATIDLSLTRAFNDRWSLMLDVPVTSNARSSLYEHGLVNGVYVKKERHSTHSFGLGDVRLAVYRWMFDPAKNTKGNVQLGLGIKLPTGDYDYKDYWYNVGENGSKELRTVDQSIQLGDGGTGFTVEANTFYNFKSNFGVYENFYYLVNPREQNGVSTARGGIPSIQTVQIGSDVMSVPDQYLIRAGVNLDFDRWMFSAGMRDECLPVHDLIGGSQGFRRPGYIISEEQGVSYSFKKFSAYAYVPVALVRNRTQSVPDKNKTALTGVYTQGDAAFADYVINVGFVIKL